MESVHYTIPDQINVNGIISMSSRDVKVHQKGRKCPDKIAENKFLSFIATYQTRLQRLLRVSKITYIEPTNRKVIRKIISKYREVLSLPEEPLLQNTRSF